MTRILTALVLIPLVVWVVLAGPQWSLLAIMALVGLIAFHEFDNIAAAQGVSPIRLGRAWPRDWSCCSRPSRCGWRSSSWRSR